jgi:hypothetical protein
VRHEVPDLGESDPVDELVRDLGLDESTSEDGDPADRVGTGEESELSGEELVGDDLLDDEEAQTVGSAVSADPLEGQSAEEAAVHVVSDSDVS